MKSCAVFVALAFLAAAPAARAQGSQTGSAWCGADGFRGTPQQVADHQSNDPN